MPNAGPFLLLRPQNNLKNETVTSVNLKTRYEESEKEAGPNEKEEGAGEYKRQRVSQHFMRDSSHPEFKTNKETCLRFMQKVYRTVCK